MAGGRSPSRLIRGALEIALIGGLLIFVASQFTTAQRFVGTLATASWEWFLLSLVLHIAYFSVYAWGYHFGFEAVDAPMPTLGLIPVVFAAMFAKTIVPVEGAGFAAVVMADASRHDQSPARAAAATLLATAVDLVTVLPFVAAGLVILAYRNALASYDLISSALFVALTGLFAAALWLGGIRPGLLRAVLRGFAGPVRRIGRLVGRPKLLGDGWAGRQARQFAAASDAIVHHRRAVLCCVGVSLLRHLANLAGVFTIFAMFGRIVAPDVLVATYGLSTAFYVISITPQGVGSVEGQMTLLISALGFGGRLAIVITLVDRIMNVWVPVVIGFVAAQWLTARSAPSSGASGKGDDQAKRQREDRGEAEASGDPAS